MANPLLEAFRQWENQLRNWGLPEPSPFFSTHPDREVNGVLWRWNPETESYQQAAWSLSKGPNYVPPPTKRERERPWLYDASKVKPIIDEVTKKQTSQKETDDTLKVVRWETVSDGGWDFRRGYNILGNVVSEEKLDRTAPKEPKTETDKYGDLWEITTDPQTGLVVKRRVKGDEEQRRWEEENRRRALESDRQYGLQSRQFEWQMGEANRQAQEERDRHLADLRANPASWLEYASYAGQTPVVQPWMQPLMPQQYAGLGAGAAIPGYQATGQGLGLPELAPPSRQYQARMGPTAQQQYFGYEQARTGASPEETQFRLWSQSAPGGKSSGLSWMR